MRTDNDLGKYAARLPQIWARRAVIVAMLLGAGYLLADITLSLGEPLEERL